MFSRDYILSKYIMPARRSKCRNPNVGFCVNKTMGGPGLMHKNVSKTSLFPTSGFWWRPQKKVCCDRAPACTLPDAISMALQQLHAYASSQGKQLCLAGVGETVESDLIDQSVSGKITPFDEKFPDDLQAARAIINGLGLEYAVTGPDDVQRHVAALVTGPDAKNLKDAGFGIPVAPLCDSVLAYGFDFKALKAIATIEKDLSLTLTFTLPKAAYSRVASGAGSSSSPFISYVNPSDPSHLFNFDEGSDGQIMVEYSIDDPSLYPFNTFGPAPVVQPNNDPLTGKANEFQVWAEPTTSGDGGNTSGFGAGVEVEVTIPIAKMPGLGNKCTALLSEKYLDLNLGYECAYNTLKDKIQLKLPNTLGNYNIPDQGPDITCAFLVKCPPGSVCVSGLK